MIRSICVMCLLVHTKFVFAAPLGNINYKITNKEIKLTQNADLKRDVSKHKNVSSTDSFPSHVKQDQQAGKISNDPNKVFQEMKHLNLYITIDKPSDTSVLGKQTAKEPYYHTNLRNENARIKVSDDIVFNFSEKRKLDSDSTSEINFAVAEFVNSESSDKKNAINNNFSSMVLTIASSLVVFFSMSTLVALFLCCCRKKKRRTANEVKDVDNAVDKNTQERNVTQLPNKDIDEKTEAKEDKPKDEKSEDDEQPSFKSRLQAFEKKDTPAGPSPKATNTPRKRPQSEAFKAFESKGIIMGMGKSPLLPRARDKKTEDENQNEKLDNTPTISVTAPEADDSKTDEDIDNSYVQPDNPDVVIADEDDDSEFGVIKRETEVLRSYRKAPPPKNRNRSSAAFRRKRAQESVGSLINEEKDDTGDKDSSVKPEKSDASNSKTKSSKNDKKDNQNVKSSRSTPEKASDKPRSKTPEISTPSKKSSSESSPEKQLASSSNLSKNSSDTKVKEKSPPKTEKIEEQVPTGGNIFLQIDPTVKKKSPDVKPKSPRGSRGNLDVQSREEKTKSSPNFLKDEKLMQALAEQIRGKKEADDENKQNKAYNRRSLNTNL